MDGTFLRIKIHSEGVYKSPSHVAGAGGLLRDSAGAWLGGFVQNLGICSSIRAELWAVYTGLTMAWNMGFSKVILEVDSQCVLDLIGKGCEDTNPNAPLVTSIRQVITRDWTVRLQHIYREGNFCADWLARAINEEFLRLSKLSLVYKVLRALR